MYIRSKLVGGRTYYQVVEGVRQGGKIRQRNVASLGTRATVPEAIEEARRQLKAWRRALKGLETPSPSRSLARKIEAATRAIGEREARIARLERLPEMGGIPSSVDTTPPASGPHRHARC